MPVKLSTFIASYALVALLGSGCAGKESMIGSWIFAVFTLDDQGNSQTTHEQIVLTDSGWNVGGGCEAPLTYQGTEANLTSADWSCTLQSREGLPFVSLNPDWGAGNLLVVKTAQFVLAKDRLNASFELHIFTKPNDASDPGSVVSFKSKPEFGGVRLEK
jgi:hypothetical protein